MIETDSVVELRQSVDEVREGVLVLRNAVDELRELIEWITRNPDPTVDQWRQIRHIFSMPLDPTVSDFHERTDPIDSQEVSADNGMASTEQRSNDQQELF